MTRDEYLALAHKSILSAQSDEGGPYTLAYATLAQAALAMVAQMDRDAAKPQPVVAAADHPDSSDDSARWPAEDPRR